MQPGFEAGIVGPLAHTLSVKRTLADSGPLVAYVGCCGQNAHSAVLQGV